MKDYIKKVVPFFCFLLAAMLIITVGHQTYQAKVRAECIRLTQQNLHTIQLALELFDSKNGTYPPTMNDPGFAAALQASSIRVFPPVNSFTGQSMKAISFHDPHVAGDYTYILLPPGVYNGKHNAADSYYLLAYGPPNKHSLDVDADGKADDVLLTLNSTCGVVWDMPAIRANGGVVEQANADKTYRSPPMSLSDALRLAD